MISVTLPPTTPAAPPGPGGIPVAGARTARSFAGTIANLFGDEPGTAYAIKGAVGRNTDAGNADDDRQGDAAAGNLLPPLPPIVPAQASALEMTPTAGSTVPVDGGSTGAMAEAPRKLTATAIMPSVYLPGEVVPATMASTGIDAGNPQTDAAAAEPAVTGPLSDIAPPLARPIETRPSAQDLTLSSQTSASVIITPRPSTMAAMGGVEASTDRMPTVGSITPTPSTEADAGNLADGVVQDALRPVSFASRVETVAAPFKFQRAATQRLAPISEETADEALPDVALTPPRPIALPTAPAPTTSVLPGTAFTGEAAIMGDFVQPRRRAETDAPATAATTETSAAMAAIDRRVTTQGTAPQAALDMTDTRWPRAMLDRIEMVRDAANAGSTKIQITPAALGSIAVNVRQDGAALHVHFVAEQASTATMIREAQPLLASLASERGLSLDQTTTNAGSGEQRWRQPLPTPAIPRPADAAPSAGGTETQPYRPAMGGRLA